MPKAKYSKQEFKDWILSRDLSRWNVEHTEDSIKLECNISKGEINFYPGEQDEDVVEMIITAKKNGDMKFYLHFELVEPEHAKELYLEMEKELGEVQEDKNLKILLSCTSGATTLFFAEKLNQAAQSLELPYEFNAVSYTELFENAPDYDMILLAPQIAYLYKKLKTAIPDKLVLQMPTATFARFNVPDAIQFIREEEQKYKEEKQKLQEQEEEEECCLCEKHKKGILAIALVHEANKNKCAYRILHNGEVILREYWLADKYNTETLFDIVNRALIADRDIDRIVFAIPGIVNASRSSYVMASILRELSAGPDFDGENLAKAVEDKYGIPTVLINSANAAALGYSLKHPEFSNITYVSQPYGYHNGGQGHVINGQLIRGLNGIAGESTVYSSRLQYSNTPDRLAKTDIGQMELIINTILPVIGVIGSDVLALRAPMVNDMTELHKNLAGFLPERFIPKLDYIDEQEAINLILDGGTQFCMDLLNQEQAEKEAA